MPIIGWRHSSQRRSTRHDGFLYGGLSSAICVFLIVTSLAKPNDIEGLRIVRMVLFNGIGGAAAFTWLGLYLSTPLIDIGYGTNICLLALYFWEVFVLRPVLPFVLIMTVTAVTLPFPVILIMAL